MIIERNFSVTCLLLLLLTSLTMAQELPARIVHDPVGIAKIGEPVRIEARLEGGVSPDQIVESKVWFRSNAEETFEYIELFPSMSTYIGEIPRDQITFDGIAYYIEMILDEDIRVTFPQIDPEQNPLIISVQSLPAAKESSLVIISPEPNKVYPSEEILVAVAFNQSVEAIDPEKIRLKINGKDVTRKANVTYDIITYLTDNLKRGRHRIEIIQQTKAGSKILKSWFFTIRPEEERRKYIERNFHGQIVAIGQTQKYSGYKENIATETFSLRGNYGKLQINGYARLTSQEQANLQPQHRYQFSMGLPWFELKVGDLNPRFNELVLWGRSVRGAQVRLGTSNQGFGVTAVMGDMKRAIEGSVNPTTLDTTAGTFRRWMGAARINFGSGKRFQLGLTGMKVKDDVESIDYGSRPKDNLVSGVDFSFFADKRRITITGQSALSLYCDNTSDSTLSDFEDFEDIIWINAHFDPLPNDTSTDIGDVVGAIMEKSLSSKARLRLRYYNNDLRLGFKRINRSFNNLANSNLDKDLEGFFIRDRIRLLRSRLYLEGSYESYQDNLGGSKEATLDKGKYDVGISVYTKPEYPDFNIKYANYSLMNDGSIQNIADPDEDEILIDSRREYSTDVISFRIFQKFQPLVFGSFRMFNELGFNLSMSDKVDAINSLDNQKFNYYSINLRSQFDLPFETTISYAKTQQELMNSISKLDNDAFSFLLHYYLLNRKMTLYSGPVFTIDSGTYYMTALNWDDYLETYPNSDPADSPQSQEMDIFRTDWIFGFGYEFLPNHILRGEAKTTSNTDDSQIQYFDNHTANAKDDPNYLDRNDLRMYLTYSYTF